MRIIMKELLFVLTAQFIVATTLACNITKADFNIRDNEVLHKSTGLVWKRCPIGYQLDDSEMQPRCTFEQLDQSGLKPLESSIIFGTFENTIQVVNDLSGSWRLPNEKEAISIVDYCTNSALVLVPEVFPQLNDLSFSEWYPESVMLTANATALRLFNVSAPVFFKAQVTSGNLSTETLLYPVRTADPLPR